MKKIINNPILMFILGAIIFGSIGSVVAYTFSAKDIAYTPTDATWKKEDGSNITNVKDAIDELKKNNNNIFVVLNPTSSFISADLSKYSKAVIFTEYTSDNYYTGLTSSAEFDIEINKTINMSGKNITSELTYHIPITFKQDGVEIGTCTYSGAAYGSGCGKIDGIILY